MRFTKPLSAEERLIASYRDGVYPFLPADDEKQKRIAENRQRLLIGIEYTTPEEQDEP